MLEPRPKCERVSRTVRTHLSATSSKLRRDEGSLSRTTTILIADRFPVVRDGLRQIVQNNPKWVVVAEAEDGLEALRRAVETQPDVAILGHSLPLLNGVVVAAEIEGRAPETEVLIYATRATDASICDALIAGARGYLLKSDSAHLLVAAIEALAQHKPFFNAMALKLLFTYLRGQASLGANLLTEHERAVVRLVAEGRTNERIARELAICLNALERHRAALKRKLSLSSKVALVRYAIRNGIFDA